MATTEARKTYELYIGGEWLPAASGETFESFDPATAEPWYEVPRGDAEDVDRAVRAARSAFEDRAWSELTNTARGALLRRLGDLIAEMFADHVLLVLEPSCCHEQLDRPYRVVLHADPVRYEPVDV